MAISYVSQPIKSNPYVLPFDQNLLARVLQFKESSFIQNANKLQQGINSLASLQMKDAQGQEYLNSKINSLVSKVNEFGAVDLSDMNINNQLDYMVTSIPQDNIISTQVAGMRMGQKMMSEYEKFRTDPKMKGNYSDANFNWSMEQFNKWRSDGNSSSSYSGPISAIPFFDNNKFYHENLKNVKAQVVDSITKPDGSSMYYLKDRQEWVDDNGIQQIVNDLTYSDPRAMQQGQINAWYLSKGKDPSTIVSSLNDETDYQINSVKSNIEFLQSQIQSHPNDIDLKNRYSSQITKLNGYIKDLEKQKLDFTVDNYNKNPDNYNFLDYQKRNARAFGNIYKVNKQTKDLKFDQSAYMERRLQIEQFKLQAELAKNGQALVDGKIVNVGANGQLNVESIFQKSTVIDTDLTRNPDALLQTEDRIRKDVANINTQEAEVSVAAVQQMIKENPNLKGIWTKELQDELTRRGQLLNPEDKSFDFDDLQFVDEMIKTGELGKYVRPGISSKQSILTKPPQTDPISGQFIPNANTSQYSQNIEDIEYSGKILRNFYDIWKNGASSGGSESDPNFQDLNLTPVLNSIQNIRREKRMYENTLKESFKKAGLSEQEQDDYIEYLNNPNSPKFKTPVYKQTAPVSRYGNRGVTKEVVNNSDVTNVDNNYILSIKNRLKNNKDYLEDISVRIQPIGWSMFNERDLSEKNVQGKNAIMAVKRQISTNIDLGFFADGDDSEDNIFKIKNKKGFSIVDDNVYDIDIFRTNDLITGSEGVVSGFNTRYYARAKVKVPDSDGKSEKIKTVRVPIAAKAIQSYFPNTFELPKEQQLTNEEVRRFGDTELVYNPKGSFRVNLRLVGVGEGENILYPKAKVQLKVQDKNSNTGFSFINIFSNSGSDTWGTPSEAERAAKALIDSYISTTQNPTVEGFINSLNRKR